MVLESSHSLVEQTYELEPGFRVANSEGEVSEQLGDSLLPMNLSLLVGHTDLLGHPGF
jgi:hypothetical protein